MSKRVIAAGIVVVVGVAVVAGVLLGQYYRSVDLGERIATVIIEPGDSFASVAGELAEKDVVQSGRMIRIAARITGVDRKLVPGRYDFTGKVSAAEVLKRLEEGDFLRIKVTIPEGSTIRKTAGLLGRTLELDSAAIVALGRDSVFLAEVGKPYLEGYLYPETYYFPWGLDEREAVRIVVGQFDRQTEDLWSDEMTLGLSKDEIVTLASIIESETSLADERGLVASVYVNRLAKKMRLDADPTVIYGLGGLDRPLYIRDLRKDTPYNTYMHKGLPPTPINSPGRASIKAALDPEESEYLFFVADNSGGHYFSKTNAEHERARRRIKAERE